jgi:hypothetical protein
MEIFLRKINKYLRKQLEIIGDKYSYTFKNIYYPERSLYLTYEQSKRFRQILDDSNLKQEFEDCMFFEHSWGYNLDTFKLKGLIIKLRSETKYKDFWEIFNHIIEICNTHIPATAVSVALRYEDFVYFEPCICRLCADVTPLSFRIIQFFRLLSLSRNPQKFMEEDFFQETRKCSKCLRPQDVPLIVKYSKEKGIENYKLNRKYKCECGNPVSEDWIIV